MKRVPIPTILTAVALVVILVVYSVTFQVRFSEAAVKVRLGRAADAAITAPGMYFKLPPPIETVRTYDTRLRVLDTNESEIKTKDGQNILVGCSTIWRIKDPLKFYVRVPNERDAESKLRERVDEVRARVIGRHNLAEFVNLEVDLVEKAYDTIQAEMLTEAAPAALNDYGIEISSVRIRRLALPEEATQTVQESMREDRNYLASRYTKEGEALKAGIRARAEQARKSILAFAERRSKEIESKGVEATARILGEVPRGAEGFFIWLRWLEALEASLRKGTTIFIDSQSDVFRNFAAPFDGAAAVAPAASASQSPAREEREE